MHPAKSVILFTVLSGAGFGLMILIGAGYPLSDNPWKLSLICALALCLSVIGLISSTFHLGHPERALLALTQWRSSWLSREGLLSIFTVSVFTLYSAAWLFLGQRISSLGVIASFGALATVTATAMIYAQLRTVPLWHNALTPVCYIGFSIASGVLLSSGVAAAVLRNTAPLIAIATLVIAWMTKMAWWIQGSKKDLAYMGSTPESATGLGNIGSVRLQERPHGGPNYLTKEMVYVIGRKHARRLRQIAMILGLIIPVSLCLIAYAASTPPLWLGLASISFLAGLLVERWLFFAEAKHSVSLYY